MKVDKQPDQFKRGYGSLEYLRGNYEDIVKLKKISEEREDVND